MKQFNTFAANSPAFSNYYSPKVQNQKRFFETEIESSRNHKNQSQVHLAKGTKIEQSEKLENDSSIQEQKHTTYQSKISLMKSHISLPTTISPDLSPHRFHHIENNITSCIFALREQKIALMEELSRKIDTKNLIEQYLSKQEIKKEGEVQNLIQSKSSKGSKFSKGSRKLFDADPYVPLQISAEILKKNEELHKKIKQIEIKQQIFGPSLQNSDELNNQKILEQILSIRQLNAKLQEQISKKLSPAQSNQNSRFITFVPQDKHKHVSIKQLLQENQELQKRYHFLNEQSKQDQIRLTTEEHQYIESLRSQNRILVSQVQQMLRHKPFKSERIIDLKNKIAQNQREKELFLIELQKFKKSMKSIRQKNQRLKHELNEL